MTPPPVVAAHGRVKAQVVGGIVALVMAMAAPSAHAADTFDAATGQLSIPIVKAFGGYFRDVVITIGGVLAVDAGGTGAAYDEYDPQDNTLFIPRVYVGDRIYSNVTVTLDRLLSVGGVLSESSPEVVCAVPARRYGDIAYPANYIADIPAPAPDPANKLAPGVTRSIGLKDYYPLGIQPGSECGDSRMRPPTTNCTRCCRPSSPG